MNGRFHSLILEEAGSQILSEALARNSRVPFAGPQAIAFDRINAERNYAVLQYAHRQHHVIVAAIEHGESSRVEALMREHANSAKESQRGQSGRAEGLMREHANAVKESINLAGFQVSAGDAAQRLALAR